MVPPAPTGLNSMKKHMYMYMKRFSNVIQNADFNHYLMFAKLLFTQPISDSPTKRKINKIGSSFDHKSAKLLVGNDSRIVPYK